MKRFDPLPWALPALIACGLLVALFSGRSEAVGPGCAPNAELVQMANGYVTSHSGGDSDVAQGIRQSIAQSLRILAQDADGHAFQTCQIGGDVPFRARCDSFVGLRDVLLATATAVEFQ